MKSRNIRLLAAFICCIVVTILYSEIPASLSDLLELNIPVRVLLQRTSLNKTHWKLTSEAGFTVYNPEASLYKELSQKELIIRYQKGALRISDTKTPQGPTYIIPKKGMLAFNTIPYEGYFVLKHDKQSAYLVNHIGLEDYLAAVIPYEAIPSWPDEVLKAQCIAARTYALFILLEHQQEPFDVYCTEQDQVYKGKKSPYDLRRIVDATRGMILTKQSKPIKAMYSAVCGGVVPAQLSSEHCEKHPYLKRTYACNHCKEQRNYRWKAHYSFDELEKTIKRRIPEIGTLEEIKIYKNDAAGVAETISLKASNKWYTMEASRFRTLLPKIRSLCCTLEPKERTLHVSGKGFGHHIGLCQWGAYYMDKKGSSYKDILSFYYPDTDLQSMEGVALTS